MSWKPPYYLQPGVAQPVLVLLGQDQPGRRRTGLVEGELAEVLPAPSASATPGHDRRCRRSRGCCTWHSGRGMLSCHSRVKENDGFRSGSTSESPGPRRRRAARPVPQPAQSGTVVSPVHRGVGNGYRYRVRQRERRRQSTTRPRHAQAGPLRDAGGRGGVAQPVGLARWARTTVVGQRDEPRAVDRHHAAQQGGTVVGHHRPRLDRRERGQALARGCRLQTQAAAGRPHQQPAHPGRGRTAVRPAEAAVVKGWPSGLTAAMKVEHTTTVAPARLAVVTIVAVEGRERAGEHPRAVIQSANGPPRSDAEQLGMSESAESAEGGSLADPPGRVAEDLGCPSSAGRACPSPRG